MSLQRDPPPLLSQGTVEPLSAPHVSRLTIHVSPPQEAISQQDSPDVLIPPLGSRPYDRYPAASRWYFAIGHRAVPCSNQVSPLRSALSRSHARHHGCSSGTPAPHISRPLASERKSARRKMNRKEREPAAEQSVRQEILRAIPAHVPLVCSDKAPDLDRVRRSSAKRDSLRSDANSRTRDYSVAPTPTPLPASRPTERERIRRIWKAIAR